VRHFQDKFDLAGECRREFVQVNDGCTELRPEIGRFCGSRNLDTIYSSGNQLRIRYYTDIPEPHTAFKASLRLARCGGSFHSPVGVIESPPRNLLLKHGKKDEEQKECVYTIELEQDQLIELKSEYIQLPAIENGNSPQERIWRSRRWMARSTQRMIVCGNTPQHLVTETNKVVVR